MIVVMKKTLLAALLAIIPLSAFAQTSSGKWDVFTSKYINMTHNITWQLPNNLTWAGRPILTEDTLLKVRNENTHILVSLAIHNGDEGV